MVPRATEPPGTTPSPAPSAAPTGFGTGPLIASIGDFPLYPQRGTSDQGGTLLGILGSMAVEAPQFIREVRPGPGAGVVAPVPYEQTQTRNVGGRDVQTQLRVATRQEIDHSTVALSRDVSETYAIPGPDGQLQATVTDAAVVRVRIEVCPDANGVVRGVVETESDTKFSATDGPGYHATFHGSDQFQVQVDDQANAGVTQHTEDATRRATGQRPAFGSEPAADTDATLQITTSHTTGAGDGVAETPTILQDDGADVADLRIALFVAGLTRKIAEEVRDAAATVWRGGRCLQVVATPGGGKVEPGSDTSITATIQHIVEQGEVARPVVATLAGAGSIDPSGTPQDAPASVSYRAATSGGSDAITFKTTSNRGIAEVTETYLVDPSRLSGVIAATYDTTDIDSDPVPQPGDDVRVRMTALVHVQLKRQGDEWVDDGSVYLVNATETKEDGWVGPECYRSGHIARASDEGAFTSTDQQLTFGLDPAASTATLFVSFFSGILHSTFNESGSGCTGEGLGAAPDGSGYAFVGLCPPGTGATGTVAKDGSGIRIDCHAVFGLHHGTAELTYEVGLYGTLRYLP